MRPPYNAEITIRVVAVVIVGQAHRLPGESYNAEIMIRVVAVVIVGQAHRLPGKAWQPMRSPYSLKCDAFQPRADCRAILR